MEESATTKLLKGVAPLNTPVPSLRGEKRQFHFSRAVAVVAALVMGGTIAISLSPHFNLAAHRSDAFLTEKCPFPEPKYEPVFPCNRARLSQYLSSALPPSLHSQNASTYIVLPTGVRPIRPESDGEYAGFKQPGNIVYIMDDAFKIDGGVVLLAVHPRNSIDIPSNLEVSLFTPIVSDREAIFLGDLPSPQSLKEQFSLSYVDDVSSLATFLANRTSSPVLTTLSIHVLRHRLGGPVVDELERLNVTMKHSEEVVEAFKEARFVKSKEEIRRLEYAGAVAAWVHEMIRKHIASSVGDVSEIELASLFTHLSTLCYARLQAYPPIVGAGSHASVLHYRIEDHAHIYKPIKRGSTVLVDAAGEYLSYASDVTRTYIRGGKWHASKEQKRVLKAVRKAYEKAVGVVREGARWSDVEGVARRVIVEELLGIGILHVPSGETEADVVKSGVGWIFMPHGLGHPVGIDVHDPIPSKCLPLSAQSSPLSSASRDYTTTPPPILSAILPSPRYSTRQIAQHLSLAPPANYTIPANAVITIEPGIYFIPYLLNTIRSGKDGDSVRLSRYIVWEEIEGGGYVDGVGGVRYENVLVVEKDGGRVISRGHGHSAAVFV
ncbi:hypothetical protein HK097_002381 [Rhizophlyctis rosea]|uniref:Peptidase M24 domain-containing protein n=1 Tax=Rhizophlyctis rosea TaxID=64517 RepID=A0AAD5S4X9_9FUNG|nr:hypothetical protein HK097_002381 [Rhizophlyctis rosea]